MQLQATDQPSNRNYGKLNLRRNILTEIMLTHNSLFLLITYLWIHGNHFEYIRTFEAFP